MLSPHPPIPYFLWPLTTRTLANRITPHWPGTGTLGAGDAEQASHLTPNWDRKPQGSQGFTDAAMLTRQARRL